MRISFKIIMLVSVVLLNIGCDQFSKSIARQNMEYGVEHDVLSDIFILVKVENTGAFLGMGAEMNETMKAILLNLLPLIVLAALLVYVFAKNNINLWLLVAIAFIVGGGVGNIIDRLLYGSVTDFMHIDIGIARTGVFNMADVSVMVGTGMLLLESFKKPKAAEPAQE